jgi:CPA2 family monovalent cation:H+ antiporter-2
MSHISPLISTVVISLVLAFILGSIAFRLRMSPLVGYLLAGIIVGPYTPGFIADQSLASELAEIGIILLMFGVGLHFSPRDLLKVKRIAIPGALAQIVIATALGMGLCYLLGWSLVAGFMFGLSLSVASTVVLLRSLQEWQMVQTPTGLIAVGWLIVEDLVMVLVLVLIPVLAAILRPEADFALINWPQTIGLVFLTLAKTTAFVLITWYLGRRIVPWVLRHIAHGGSRELFCLGVLAIALGIAYVATAFFDVSFALGAFFAGMLLKESPLSHRAAEESLPLRDAFSVLFFISVGMLFNPSILINHPWLVLATFLIIVLGKSIVAYFIVKAFGYARLTALTIAVSLAQIGEFSFILIGLAISLNLISTEGRDLILAGGILSIIVNPTCFVILDQFKRRYPDRAVTDETIIQKHQQMQSYLP